MAGYHNITGIRRTTPRTWRIGHFSRFSDGQEITTSHTIDLPGTLPNIRENIHIRGFERKFAEAILDSIATLLIERKEAVDPGDTVEYERKKFLVLRESVPPSICTLERSILVLHLLKPTEQQF